MKRRCHFSGFLDRFRNVLWNCVVKHVPSARHQAEDAIWNLRVKPAGLFDIDDTILCTRHNYNSALLVPDSGAAWR
jgi:hypothetical protein